MKQQSILVVESDDDQRRLISGWLDEAEYTDVMFCPGPSAPDYVCLGGRGAACPLAVAADIVLIDLRLRSDELLMGTPGWQLLIYYLELGKQIVAISDQDDPVRPRSDSRVRVVRRPLERTQFLDAVRSKAAVSVA